MDRLMIELAPLWGPWSMFVKLLLHFTTFPFFKSKCCIIIIHSELKIITLQKSWRSDGLNRIILKWPKLVNKTNFKGSISFFFQFMSQPSNGNLRIRFLLTYRCFLLWSINEDTYTTLNNQAELLHSFVNRMASVAWSCSLRGGGGGGWGGGGVVGISDILQGQCKIKDSGCRASDHIFTKDTLWRTHL